VQIHNHADPLNIASDLTIDLPRDQALGLRLLALARACVQEHRAQEAAGAVDSAKDDTSAQDAAGELHILRSQASVLLRLRQAHGLGSPCHAPPGYAA